MKASYEFTKDVDLGKLGTRTCSIDYSAEDGDVKTVELMSVWTVDAYGSLGIEITDYLTHEANEEFVALAQADLPEQLQAEWEWQQERAMEEA